MQGGENHLLARHVEEEARGEAFVRFMEGLYANIHALAESRDVRDNLAAVRAIDELIDVEFGEIATKIVKFGSSLRRLFESKTDRDVLVNASGALGHLAAAGGALTADVVEYQVTNSCLKSFFPILTDTCINYRSCHQVLANSNLCFMI